MKKWILFIAAILTLCSSVAMATKWIEIYEDEEAVVYADFSSMTRFDNKVKMWVLNDYKKVEYLFAEKVLSYRHLLEYDCFRNRTRLLQISSHSGNMGTGKVVDKTTKVMPWIPLFYRTKKNWEYACGIR